MTDFKLDQESVSWADRLSSQLMTDFGTVVKENIPKRRFKKLFSKREYKYYEFYKSEYKAVHTPINDVLTNMSKMAIEFAMAGRWDEGVPCIKFNDREIAPFSYFGNDNPDIDSRRLLYSHWKEFLQNKSREEDCVILTYNEAKEGIQRSLSNFLAYRFDGIRKWAARIQKKGASHICESAEAAVISDANTRPKPSAVGGAGRLRVQVSCNTPGLRIHVSPAYFINWSFFGSPTTPVTGYVSPGRYVFSADGPMLPRRKRDTGIFCVPPTFYPSLAKF